MKPGAPDVVAWAAHAIRPVHLDARRSSNDRGASCLGISVVLNAGACMKTLVATR